MELGRDLRAPGMQNPLLLPGVLTPEACLCSQVSQEVMHLLSIMLVPEPTCRCNLATVMSHPW